MKTKSIIATCLAASLFISASASAAPAAKTYQATGPVVEVTDTTITIMKGDEKWQIARSPDLKVSGDLKVGAKVTVEYRMVATSVEVKAEKASEKSEKAEKAVEKADKSEKKADKKK